MSFLLPLCEQVLNLVQSYVTLRVPLFVSYIFHSPVAVGGWQHFDLQSELKLTFVYDTAILWQDGIGSPPEAELQGTFSYHYCLLPAWCMQIIIGKLWALFRNYS